MCNITFHLQKFTFSFLPPAYQDQTIKKKERKEYTFSEKLKKKETVIKAKFKINFKITYVAYKYLKTCEALKKITFKMLIF